MKTSLFRSFLLALATALVACSSATRNAAANAAPTVPPEAPCAPGAHRCAVGVPESCRSYEGHTRWWPLVPLNASGRPAACAHACVADDAGAYCGPASVALLDASVE